MAFAKAKSDFKKASKAKYSRAELVDRIRKKTKIKKEIINDVLEVLGDSVLELVCETNELNAPIHFGTGVKFMLVKRWSVYDRKNIVGVASSITNNVFKARFKELRDGEYAAIKKLLD